MFLSVICRLYVYMSHSIKCVSVRILVEAIVSDCQVQRSPINPVVCNYCYSGIPIHTHTHTDAHTHTAQASQFDNNACHNPTKTLIILESKNNLSKNALDTFQPWTERMCSRNVPSTKQNKCAVRIRSFGIRDFHAKLQCCWNSKHFHSDRFRGFDGQRCFFLARRSVAAIFINFSTVSLFHNSVHDVRNVFFRLLSYNWLTLMHFICARCHRYVATAINQLWIRVYHHISIFLVKRLGEVFFITLLFL